MTDSETVYTITDPVRRNTIRTTNTEHADRLARSGFYVTAETR
jgi:hypothetical protein